MDLHEMVERELEERELIERQGQPMDRATKAAIGVGVLGAGAVAGMVGRGIRNKRRWKKVDRHADVLAARDLHAAAQKKATGRYNKHKEYKTGLHHSLMAKDDYASAHGKVSKQASKVATSSSAHDKLAGYYNQAQALSNTFDDEHARSSPDHWNHKPLTNPTGHSFKRAMATAATHGLSIKHGESLSKLNAQKARHAHHQERLRALRDQHSKGAYGKSAEGVRKAYGRSSKAGRNVKDVRKATHKSLYESLSKFTAVSLPAVVTSS